MTDWQKLSWSTFGFGVEWFTFAVYHPNLTCLLKQSHAAVAGVDCHLVWIE